MSNPITELKQGVSKLGTEGKNRIKGAFKRLGSSSKNSPPANAAAAPASANGANAAPAANPAARPAPAAAPASPAPGVANAANPPANAANAVSQVVNAAVPPADLQKFNSMCDKALTAVVKMRKLPGAEVERSGVGARVKAANELIKKASEAAGKATAKEQVEEQIKELQKIALEYREAQTKSDAYVKASPTNLGKFEDKLREAYDRLAKVRLLRGAGDHEELEKAEKALTEIAAKARLETADKDAVALQIQALEDIEKNADKVKEDAKAAKKSSKVKLAAYADWSETLAAAQDARIKLAEDPFAKAEYKQICDLILAAEALKRSDGPQAALDKLNGKEAPNAQGNANSPAGANPPAKAVSYKDLVTAVANQKEELKKDLPELSSTRTAVEAALKEYGKYASKHQIAERNAEKDRLLFEGLKNSASAKQGLEKLDTKVQQETKALEQFKAKADEALKKYETEAQAMVDGGLDLALIAFLNEEKDRAKQNEFAASEWEDASIEFTRLLEELKKVDEAQGKFSKLWQGLATDRKDLHDAAAALIKWPPAVQRSREVLDALIGLEKELKQSHDYEAAVKNFNALQLDKVIGKLKEDFKARNAQEFKPEAVDALVKELQEARKLYATAEENTAKFVKKVEDKLEGMANPASNHLRARLNGVTDAWLAYIASFKDLEKKPWSDFAAPSAASGLTADKMVAPFTKELTKIKEEAEKASKSTVDLEDFQTKAIAHETAAEADRLPDALADLLAQLDRLGLPLPDEHTKLKDLKKADDATRSRDYPAMRTRLQGILDDRRAVIKTEVDDKTKAIESTVDAPLKRLKGRHSGFQEYQKELESDAAALAEMVESGDLFLLQASQKEKAALLDKIKAIDPKQRGDGATRYKDVTERLKKLSSDLGYANLREYLPATHRELESRLVSLHGQAKRSSPAEGLDLLTQLSTDIANARTRADAARKQREQYIQQRERVENQWGRVKRLTDTRLTDSATHFADWFSEHLSNADAASKTEGDEKGTDTKRGPARGMALLKEVSDKLDTIEKSGDGTTARYALQKEDASIEQSNREIRDLARLFKDQVKFLKGTTIPEARKFLETQEDADLEMLKHLETSITQVQQTVQPYLDMISSKPKLGKIKAPDGKQAKREFNSATAALEAAARTVLALRSGVGSTEVDVTGDLKAVAKNWHTKTANYKKAMVDLADEITLAASNDSQADIDNAAAAAKLIKHAADDFRAGVFDAAFQVITDTPKGKDKDKDKPRLAAREKALKTMRSNRDKLLKHPVHTSLAAANNVFKGSKVHTAARDLLIALKRIELEVLVGV